MDLTDILERAVEMGCSDVVLTVDTPVVYRIDGKLTTIDDNLLNHEEVKKIAYGILTSEQVARFERDKELDFSFHCPIADTDESIRIRGNLFLQRKTVGAVFRLIATRIPTLEELGLPPLMTQLALSPQGLILVTGPTGHGKSTTLAAMVNIINMNRQAHIITIEDPLEYLHTNLRSVIEQREVGDDTHGFSNALRHCLRQAPDVILVGEMRDIETMTAGITAAETGHLVLASLHTNDCVQTIDRIIDSFPSHQQNQVRSQLALSLKAILSQRLIPRVDAEGRALAFEILLVNPAVAHLIREKKAFQVYGLMETASKEGMITMDACLKRLYYNKVISLEDCQSRMRHPAQLTRGISSPPASSARSGHAPGAGDSRRSTRRGSGPYGRR